MALTLSETEKEEIMNNYRRIAWRTVHRYRGNKTLSREDREDLHQECMVELIKHLNKCESEEEIYDLQIMNLVKAISSYLMKGCVLTGTHQTVDMSRILSAQPVAVSISDLMAEQTVSDSPNGFVDNVILKVDLERFINELSPRQREVFLLALCGYKNREIAERQSVSEAAISMNLKKTKSEFAEYLLET